MTSLPSLLALVLLAAEPSDPLLRAELILLRDLDQGARRALFGHDPAGEWGELVSRYDEVADRRLEELIARKGWPTPAMVGDDGAEAAWTLALHAAPALQKKCLELLGEAVKRKQAPPEPLARLTDKVLVRETGKQRYGTQLDFLPDGGARPAPGVEEPAKLEARRKALGLQVPYDAYLRERRRGYEAFAASADGGS